MGSERSGLGPIPVFALVLGGFTVLFGVVWAAFEATETLGPWWCIGGLLVLGVPLTVWGVRNADRVS